MKTLEQAIVENPETPIELLSEFYPSELEMEFRSSSEGEADRLEAARKENEIQGRLLSCEP